MVSLRSYGIQYSSKDSKNSKVFIKDPVKSLKDTQLRCRRWVRSPMYCEL